LTSWEESILTLLSLQQLPHQGGGSGIGKAISFKLATQGLNVVVVSLDDDILKETMKQLQETFPKQQFKSVGCSFSPGVEYLKKIQDATKDIEVPIIFNNAGCKLLWKSFCFL
jgi:NADP-dependent 3-hydroxy acid dehydrogenase YdfG